jgi:hypothetical protein
MTNKEEIDQLRADLTALKRQFSGEDIPSEKEAAEWRDKMHQLAERRASQHNPFTRDQLAAMRAACPDPQSIVHDQRGAPTGPASIIPSSTDKVRGSVGRGSVGGGTGWQHQIPLRNGLGQGK